MSLAVQESGQVIGDLAASIAASAGASEKDAGNLALWIENPLGNILEQAGVEGAGSDPSSTAYMVTAFFQNPLSLFTRKAKNAKADAALNARFREAINAAGRGELTPPRGPTKEQALALGVVLGGAGLLLVLA